MAPRIFFPYTLHYNPGFVYFLPHFFVFIYLLKNKTIETHALAFLPLNISAVGSVYRKVVSSRPVYYSILGRFYKKSLYISMMEMGWIDCAI